MGKKDIHVSHYFSHNPFFADMANGYFFGGQQVVAPEDLKEADKELLTATMVHAKRVTRDNVKKYYTDTLICIYVLEHQDTVDYHMVLRNMLSESMEYQRQWEENKKSHLKEKTLKSNAEFLSGMKKSDLFVPVISMVVYYGDEKWDGAKCLHGLLNLENVPPPLRKYIENYHIHVFDYHDYEDFGMFHTELKQVFQFLKCSRDKAQLTKMLAEHQAEYYNVSREACELLAAITHSKELLKFDKFENEENGGINMCKALEDIRTEGEWTKLISMVQKKLDKGLSTAEIADMLEESEPKIEELMDLIKANPGKTSQELSELYLQSPAAVR